MTSLLHGGRWAGWLLPLLLLIGPARPAADPARIAVGGMLPSGYVGVLARYGLPRDLLSDDQLADPEVIGRYDVVIVAGLSWEPNPATALDAYLAQGGSVLLDYSAPNPALRHWFRGRANNQQQALMYGVAARSRSPFTLAGGDNPLRAEDLPTTFEPVPRSFAPAIAEPANATVLATFQRTTAAPNGQVELAERNDRRQQLPENGPSAPAIVLESRGNGRVMLCGPALGMATSLAGADYDQLILAMLRVLTDGHAAPQLTPEGPRLGRKQSQRSLGDTGEIGATEEEEVATEVEESFVRPPGKGPRGNLPTGFQLVEELPAPCYDLTGSLAGGPCELLLNYWNAANHVKAVVSTGEARIVRVENGVARTLASAKPRLSQGASFLLKERADRITLVAGGSLLQATAKGLHDGAVAARGVAGELGYQSWEEPFFTDDFMRTNDTRGPWTTVGGRWETAPVENPDMGANPFSYKVEAPETAIALTGYSFWDEYRLSAALRPSSGSGVMGLGIYAADANNLIRFEANLASGLSPSAEGLRLVRVSGGKPTVLAAAAGCLVRDQWYSVQITVAGAAIRVAVDGTEVLSATDSTFSGGQVALYARGAQGRFDDVVVEPSATEFLSGQRLQGVVPDYAGTMDVDSWAGPATPWEAVPGQPGLFWRRHTFFGAVGMRYPLADLPDGASASLAADGDGSRFDSAASITCQRRGQNAIVRAARRGEVLAEATVAVPPGASFALRLGSGKLAGLLDDKVVVSAPVSVGQGRLAFLAQGYRPRISGVAVWSRNLSDYTFDTAPVDWWVGSGTWDVTNRWSCTPDWSWFGGFSKDKAAIWYKSALSGDQVVDFYVGPKMMPELAKKERMGDFNAVLCGDGKAADSGYSFVVGSEQTGTLLTRQGLVVARNPRFRLFRMGHNRWANLRVEKHGARVSLAVDGQVVLDYVDPEPLPGGYAAIWTQNNGVMLPRITLSYERRAERPLTLP